MKRDLGDHTWRVQRRFAYGVNGMEKNLRHKGNVDMEPRPANPRSPRGDSGMDSDDEKNVTDWWVQAIEKTSDKCLWLIANHPK